MTKQKIVGALVALLVVAGIGFTYFGDKLPQITKTEISINNPLSTSSTTAEDVKTETVDVQVGTPINGELKGVIEVGASGFNSFVINVDKDKNWEMVDKQFGESLAYEGFATTNDVKVQLKKYLGAIFAKGVSGRNVHFVISSGALKNPKTELIAKAIQQDGFVVNRATADQEGKLALKASLPKEYQTKGYSVDMGSGNTKVSWYENGRAKTVEVVGAKYYQNGVTDADAYNQLKEALNQVPKELRQNCFIIGGVPFQLAQQVQKNGERFVLLANPDTYSAGKDVKLKSGLNLYRAIYDEAGSKTVFDMDANFTVGFLLGLN